VRSSQAPLLTRLGLYLWGTHYIADITKAQQKLGYRQQVSFREGMKLLAEWYAKTKR
jgi:nucleoside-diphosphate-sugar epimerase